MAHEGLWEQLVVLDRHETARRAKCDYLVDPDCYVVTMLKTDYEVNLAGKEIISVRPDSPPKPAGFLEQLCILAYLINARDVPLANKLVRAEALPGGQFFFRGLHRLPTEKLQEVFGHCPERLHEVAPQFDAKRCDFGDASIELTVLPRIPLTIVVWRADDEFAARASILFDQTVGSQLPLDALGAAVNLVVEAIVKAAAEVN
jgi:hypothetical protein